MRVPADPGSVKAMLLSLKELIVVSAISAIIFWLAKPVARLFIPAEDFSRRRNVWYGLTVIAFISPSFWLFVILAIPIMAIAGRKDSNPSALYLMLLHVIPPFDVPVPMIGMPYLFLVDNYLLLSFCVMTPAALRIWRSKGQTPVRRPDLMDYSLLAYGLLSSIIYIHTQTPDGDLYPGSLTESMRRAFVFFFGVYVPYFSMSRINCSRKVLVDSMAAFCLGCAIMAAIAVFESARHWLLYDMAWRWGYGGSFSFYLKRGAGLRATASSGHSLALGDLLVVALGLWLYLETHLESMRLRIGGKLLFCAGLLAAYARGAWVGGVTVYFLFAMLRPNPVGKFLKATGALAVVSVLIYVSPLSSYMVSVLPFLGGTVDAFNVDYRQRLWMRSWEVIGQSPIWGDPAAMLKLQDLRQGQGIIDLVNTYVEVLLGNGFVGLMLFLLFILVPCLNAWSLCRKSMRADLDFGLLGASLVSCIVVTLLLIENGSFIGAAERIFYVIAALAAGYVYLGRRSQPDLLVRPVGAGKNALPR